MFLIERLWTIFLLIVIFQSILINSLPQNPSESEYTLQDDYTFSTDPEPLGNTFADDIGSDTVVPTNSDPFNVNENVIAVAETVKDCPNETGQKKRHSAVAVRLGHAI